MSIRMMLAVARRCAGRRRWCRRAVDAPDHRRMDRAAIIAARALQLQRGARGARRDVTDHGSVVQNDVVIHAGVVTHTIMLPDVWMGFGVNAAFPLEPTILIVAVEAGGGLVPGAVVDPLQLHVARAPARASVDPSSRFECMIFLYLLNVRA